MVVFRVSERLGVRGRDVSILHTGGDRRGYLSCVTQTRSATWRGRRGGLSARGSIRRADCGLLTLAKSWGLKKLTEAA